MKWIVRAEWISYDRIDIHTGTTATTREDRPIMDYTADTWLVEASSKEAAIAAIGEPWENPPTEIRAWRSEHETAVVTHIATDRAPYWKYKPQTQKKRTERLQMAAQQLLRDSDWKPNHPADMPKLAPILAKSEKCHIETARRHLAKAAQIMQGEEVAQRGGKRPGAGRPKA